jgi:hypothetical protein
LIYFHKRVRFHALGAFAVPGVGLAVAANTIQPADPQQVLLILGGFIVVVAGASALAWVRWLNKVEANVPRDPDRVAETLKDLRDEVRAVRSDVSDIGERVARIEGALGARR